ncbi:MAG: FxsA family protein [Rhodospirillales bacterium]
MPALIVALVLLVPLVEIAGFIVVGDAIGLWPTLALVVLAALAGALLLRLQGIATIRRVQAALARRQAPVVEIFDAFCLMIAAVLLIIPGFVSDAIALLLLLSPVRSLLRRRMKVYAPPPPPGGPPGGGPVIDGDYHEIDRSDRLPPREPRP